MKKNQGQILVILLVLMSVATTIAAAATVVTLVSSRSANTLQQGVSAYYLAESGIENGLLRLLRDPKYTGETINIGEGTTTITVSGDGDKTITSEGKIGNFVRTIEVVTQYNNDILTILSWKELF